MAGAGSHPAVVHSSIAAGLRRCVSWCLARWRRRPRSRDEAEAGEQAESRGIPPGFVSVAAGLVGTVGASSTWNSYWRLVSDSELAAFACSIFVWSRSGGARRLQLPSEPLQLQVLRRGRVRVRVMHAGSRRRAWLRRPPGPGRSAAASRRTGAQSHSARPAQSGPMRETGRSCPVPPAGRGQDRSPRT